MNSRLIRVLLVVFAIAIGSAAGYFLKDIDTKLTTARTAAGVLHDRARALTATIADLRAGQVAYVARGQGEAFWMTRVSNLKPTLEKQSGEFSATLTAPGARAAFEPAAAALENFQKLDSRVQDYVNGSNALLAADLIFSDGLEATTTAIGQIDIALNEELQGRQAEAGAMRRRQLAVLGGSAGAILLIVLVLAFTGGAKAAQLTVPVEQAEPVAAPVSPAKLLDLAGTAQLCTDLGRVVESGQLPGLLERTAGIIDASGVIVWIAAPGGHELRPAMSHGYPDKVMARMGSIPREASNAAAAAYRSSEMRTVAGNGVANGAIIAPLMTTEGCIGVLSAEIKGGLETNEGSQALLSIVAAQLATLVSTPTAAPARAVAQA